MGDFVLDKSRRYFSRDLSWLKFNDRVLDQVKDLSLTLFERLHFLSISASNLDEFFMIRVGRLYNYIDYERKQVDIAGMRAIPLRKKLLSVVQAFVQEQHHCFLTDLYSMFENFGFFIENNIANLSQDTQKLITHFFNNTIFPMLTPMVFDRHHTFPVLMNKLLIFGVITYYIKDGKKQKKFSFIQLPRNLQRFYEVTQNGCLYFIPIEEIVRKHIGTLFKNVAIDSVTLFRITRSGNFSLEENDDIDASFVEELKYKLKKRKTGRVLRIEIEEKYNAWMMSILQEKWNIDEHNIFITPKESLLDFVALQQIIYHNELKEYLPTHPQKIPPFSYPMETEEDIFAILQQRDIILHHPYNSINLVIDLLEKAAEDPYVLSIKITIYRLAKNSMIIAALLKAAENGKYVSVLFELKARFDEENNMREAQKLQNAGCFVIYGIGNAKTHSKLLFIVRKKEEKVTCYVHMSTGNYNENTAEFYTDISLMTTNKVYTRDVSEFFNAITGHSIPKVYKNLITTPFNMRKQLIELIEKEIYYAKKQLPCGIVIKINSLEDEETIEAFYRASQAGVPIKLIVRGICCLIPGKKGLSDHITVRSIIGNFLEHARIYYFHNNNKPKIYIGSADIMVRSFDRRIESLFLIQDALLKKQVTHILSYNLKDNQNTYIMDESGIYNKIKKQENEAIFNIHEAFFKVNAAEVEQAQLF